MPAVPRVLAALAALAVLAIAGVPDASPPRRKPAVDVTGTYDSNYGRVTLTQHGTLVEGDYECCGGGHLTGRLVGRVIKYHWEEGEGTAGGGSGVWQVVAGGALRGTWGTGDSVDDGGEWNLDRAADIAN